MVNAEQPRVLMLCRELDASGIPQVVLNVTKHLKGSVDEITIGYLGGGDELVPEFTRLDVPVVQLGDGMGDPHVMRSLWRLISAFRPTVIHTHEIAAASWGRIVGWLRRVPVVSTIHTPYDDRSAAARTLDLSTSLLPTVNVSVSNAVDASLPPYFGLSTQSAVVYNSIDPEEIRAKGNVAWDEAGWNTEISEEQPIIANVARFDPKKRRVDLVRALPTIHEEFPDAVVVFTGWGEHRQHVETVTRSLGVEESVHFVGNIPNPYSVYRHADVIALPSVSEGFSISMLEAMAFAKPIVATDIPPFREALGPEYPLLPTRDPETLAVEIRRCLREPERAKRAGTAARERVERRFSGRAAAQSYFKIYESVGS